MKEGYWVIRTYESGNVGEKIKFFVPGERRSGRSRRREKEELRKQAQNEYSAVKQLARLINANFGAGDILLGLDYTDEGLGKLFERAKEELTDDAEEAEIFNRVREAADREMKLCIRRSKRELEKSGVDIRYIALTSDMDGDTGEAVRVHHHLIVPADALEAFVAKWRLGGVSWSPLWIQSDYTPLAEYLLRQVRRLPDAKKYVSSRNLIRPAPRDRVVHSDSELRVPRGGKILFRNEYKPGRAQYIRYTIPISQSINIEEEYIS